MPFALRVFPAVSVATEGNPKSIKSNSKNNSKVLAFGLF